MSYKCVLCKGPGTPKNPVTEVLRPAGRSRIQHSKCPGTESTCEIGWVDKKGKPTYHDAPAIGIAVLAPGYIKGGLGQTIRRDEQRFLICAKHAERIEEPGMEDWSFSPWWGKV